MHLCLSDGAATPADAHVSDVYAWAAESFLSDRGSDTGNHTFEGR